MTIHNQSLDFNIIDPDTSFAARWPLHHWPSLHLPPEELKAYRRRKHSKRKQRARDRRVVETVYLLMKEYRREAK